jgi:hypothetical protein
MNVMKMTSITLKFLLLEKQMLEKFLCEVVRLITEFLTYVTMCF